MKYNKELIMKQYEQNENLKYVFFWGHTEKDGQVTKACFSQWYPCTFVVEGVTYHTAEQYMMAQIVVAGNYAKFSQNKELEEFLLQTNERVLVEASPYDAIWGIGMSATTTGLENPATWKGQNLLGFALMEVRDRLQEGKNESEGN